MDLALLFDHRFYRDEHGIVFSLQNYNYGLFAKRYLQVFDRIRIYARVAEHPPRPRAEHERTEGEGVEVIALGNWTGPGQFMRCRARVRARLTRELMQGSACIMISPGTLANLMFPHFLRKGYPYGVEVVTDPYDVFADGANTHPLRQLFQWWFTRQLRMQCAGARAAAYVTESALQRRYPPPPTAFTTHYSSIELLEEAFVAAPPARGDSRPLHLVTVGTLAQLYKAPDILIDAVAMCVQAGLDLELTMIGDGKHRAELEARAGALGLGERIRFLGQLSAGMAIRQHLDQADLFVLPSRQEGVPRAMIEAMARALPCIGSTIGGIPELLPAEDMVPVNDVHALARKILEVARDPERRARMAARNLQRAGNYRAEILQQRRLAMYRTLRETTEAYLSGHHEDAAP